MIDTHEAILARLLVILGTIDGVAVNGAVKAVGRNIDDLPAGWINRRPAIMLKDGTDEYRTSGDQRIRPGKPPPQRRELTPLITVLAGADAKDIGGLLSMFRARLLAAIMFDAELAQLVGTTPHSAIHFAKDETIPAGPESKEGRMELTFVLTYVLNFTDLV